MGATEALLETVRVDAARLAVERPEPGPVVLRSDGRWSMVAPARGTLALDERVLVPGDCLLGRRRDVAGTVGDGGATVLVARFALHGIADRLLQLPQDLVVVPGDSELCRLLIERLAAELEAGGDGESVVSTRLLDWLVAAIVRDVVIGAAPHAALDDPVVAAAFAAIHDDPAAAWTVETLARRAGVSRAALAQRFRDAVGTSPLSYVREHRLDLAERALISEPEATVASIARRVGYASPFSFSTAFRRHRGLAPSEVRQPDALPG